MKLYRENVYINKCLENERVAENRNGFCGWSEKYGENIVVCRESAWGDRNR